MSSMGVAVVRQYEVPGRIGAARGHPDRPVHSLLNQGERGQLIVVGGRGRGGFSGLLLDSTSQALLWGHAPWSPWPVQSPPADWHASIAVRSDRTALIAAFVDGRDTGGLDEADASRATSVPEAPIATPMLARLGAGAGLTRPEGLRRRGHKASGDGRRALPPSHGGPDEGHRVVR